VCAFSAALDLAYTKGYEVHGELGLSRESLSSRVTAILSRHVAQNETSDARVRLLDELHVIDLYLATACALPDDGAWHRLTSIYRGHLKAVYRSTTSATRGSGDLADTVFGYLYMPNKSGQRRIGSYSGSGPLSKWLGTVLRNIAVKEQWATDRGFDSLDDNLDVTDARVSPEASLRVREQSALISSALVHAVRRLCDTERRLLKLRYGDQLQVSQIARECGVNPSSITRHLDRILTRINATITEYLSTRHHLSQSDMRSCIRDFIENPTPSVLTMFD
jgi:RNA polymerase sigma-70 factor